MRHTWLPFQVLVADSTDLKQLKVIQTDIDYAITWLNVNKTTVEGMKSEKNVKL